VSKQRVIFQPIEIISKLVPLFPSCPLSIIDLGLSVSFSRQMRLYLVSPISKTGWAWVPLCWGAMLERAPSVGASLIPVCCGETLLGLNVPLSSRLVEALESDWVLVNLRRALRTGLLSKSRHALLILTIVYRCCASWLKASIVIWLHTRLTIRHRLAWLLIIALLRHLLLGTWRSRTHRWSTHILLLLHWRDRWIRGDLVLLPARQDENDCGNQNSDDSDSSDHSSSNRTGVRLLAATGGCRRGCAG
jgi:hypothetical protein